MVYFNPSLIVGDSSNGRTADSGSVCRGSNPRSPASSSTDRQVRNRLPFGRLAQPCRSCLKSVRESVLCILGRCYSSPRSLFSNYLQPQTAVRFCTRQAVRKFSCLLRYWSEFLRELP